MFRSQSNGLSLPAIGAVLLLSVWHSRSASSAVPEGIWMFANRVAVQLFDCSGQLCGRIVWLLRPRTPAGQPDLDTLNPEPSLRQRHLCGLTIIWGLQPGAPDHWILHIRDRYEKSGLTSSVLPYFPQAEAAGL